MAQSNILGRKGLKNPIKLVMADARMKPTQCTILVPRPSITRSKKSTKFSILSIKKQTKEIKLKIQDDKVSFMFSLQVEKILLMLDLQEDQMAYSEH